MTTGTAEGTDEAPEETMARAEPVLASIVEKLSGQHPEAMAGFARLCGYDPEAATQLLMKALAGQPELLNRVGQPSAGEAADEEDLAAIQEFFGNLFAEMINDEDIAGVLADCTPEERESIFEGKEPGTDSGGEPG